MRLTRSAADLKVVAGLISLFKRPKPWQKYHMMMSIDLLEHADEDETCEECSSTEDVCIFDGWLALCRDCAEREVAPDHAQA